MVKLLLVVLAFAVAYWLLKAYKRKVEGRPAQQRGSASSEDMVRCAQCGVHLPRSESLMSGEVFYCSAEHRHAHQKRTDHT